MYNVAAHPRIIFARGPKRCSRATQFLNPNPHIVSRTHELQFVRREIP
jgi:hypothetical protein